MAAVKRLAPCSVRELAVIEERCFGDERWNEAMLAAEFGNPLSELYGITEGGRLAAYLSVKLILDEAHVGNLAVLPEYRRKGYASRLLKHLFKRCLKAGVKAVTLEVNTGNVLAVRLYESHGFKRSGLRKNYYRNGGDALIMWKDI